MPLIGSGKLAGYNAIIPDDGSTSINAEATFIYDTTLDDDGGAWRSRVQHTSWYNETLNTTYRGSRKDFPVVALITAFGDELTIWDMDSGEPKMWMRFISTATSHSWFTSGVITTSSSLTCIHAKNGVIAVGQSGDYKGLTEIRMIADDAYNRCSTNYWGHAKFRGNLAQRNQNLGRDSINSNANRGTGGHAYDVKLYFRPGAATDKATGFPKYTVAVATTATACIIKETQSAGGDDGATIKNVYSGGAQMRGCAFAPNGRAVFGNQHIAGQVGARLHYVREAPDYDSGLLGLLGWTSGHDGFASSSGTGGNGNDYWDSFEFLDNYTLALGAFDGFLESSSIAKLKPTPGGGYAVSSSENKYTFDISNSMVAHFGEDFNTGWMPGNTCIGSFACNTYTDNVAINMLADPSFDTGVGGWTGTHSGVTLTHNGTYMTITPNGSNIWCGAQQTVTGLTPGKRYVFRFKVGSSSWHSVDISYVGGSSASKVSGGVSNSAGTGGTTTWREGKIEFTAQESYVYLAINTSNLSGSNEIGVDYAYFQEAISGYATNYQNFLKGRASTGGSALYAPYTDKNVTRQQVNTGSELTSVKLGAEADAGNLRMDYKSGYNNFTNVWTFAMWIKRYSNATWDMIISMNGPNATHGDGISWYTNNALRIRGNNEVDLQFGSTDWDTSTEWKHLVVSSDGALVTVYCNGEIRATSTSIPTMGLESDAHYTVGEESYNTSYTYRVNGRGKEIALMKISGNKISEEQVKTMYQQEKALFAPGAKMTVQDRRAIALAVDHHTDTVYFANPGGYDGMSGLLNVDSGDLPDATNFGYRRGFSVNKGTIVGD